MAAKKKFPGIFYVIAISFVVYLTVVTMVILFHYQKPKKGNANKNIQVSSKLDENHYGPYESHAKA
jgi:glycopeptide antibiotics resistance protein